MQLKVYLKIRFDYDDEEIKSHFHNPVHKCPVQLCLQLLLIN